MLIQENGSQDELSEQCDVLVKSEAALTCVAFNMTVAQRAASGGKEDRWGGWQHLWQGDLTFQILSFRFFRGGGRKPLVSSPLPSQVLSIWPPGELYLRSLS